MNRSTLTRISAAMLCVALLGAPGGCGSGVKTTARAASDQTPSIASTIDGWHAAAGQADFETYFGSMTDDAVFLGTDATERWTRPEFEVFARPYFDDGRGWAYEPIERKIMISPDGKTAWFDERLANEGLGECRGTGVVELGRDRAWRIAHYSLTIPIPNALARDVAGRIKLHAGEPDVSANPERVEADTP